MAGRTKIGANAAAQTRKRNFIPIIAFEDRRKISGHFKIFPDQFASFLFISAQRFILMLIGLLTQRTKGLFSFIRVYLHDEAIFYREKQNIHAP